MYPRKDSQDKDSINTEATEYSKSGTDDASAKQEEAAFDPSTTDPKEEKKVAGEGQVSFFPGCFVWMLRILMSVFVGGKSTRGVTC